MDGKTLNTLLEIVKAMNTPEKPQVTSAHESTQEKPQVNSAYKIGQNYMFRSVTHIVTGRLVAVYDDCFVVEDAAWIADTGRYAQAVKTGVFKEVEPYPDGAEVVVNRGALIDAVIIPTLPREQK